LHRSSPTIWPSCSSRVSIRETHWSRRRCPTCTNRS
jgi:hypothetical protein